MTEHNVFFQPFVGKDYAHVGIFSKRIMILGESHYCDEDCADCGCCQAHRECAAFTDQVVRQYLDGCKDDWARTFLKFERSLVGHETSMAERQQIWQSVMFYNYLQVAMGGPRAAGTTAQYRQAGDALYEVMEKYLPDCIIAWGNRLWDRLPDRQWTDGKDITIDGYRVATGHYTLRSGKQVRVMAVNHPSVGYSWDYWHRVIAAFMG